MRAHDGFRPTVGTQPPGDACNTSLVTKAQIDRLGERLRGADIEEADRRLLADYRRSFGPAYEQAITILSDTRLMLAPTGREKTTISISQKLKRGSIRLSQMQDIVGCRVVVPDPWSQDLALRMIWFLFSTAGFKVEEIDRREHPSHGYRAVHIIAWIAGRPVEIQVRTALQHWWAELSEKLSDLFDSDLKYGGGPVRIREALTKVSQRVGDHELTEKRMIQLEADLEYRPDIADSMTGEEKAVIEQARNALEISTQELISRLKASVAQVQRKSRPSDPS